MITGFVVSTNVLSHLLHSINHVIMQDFINTQQFINNVTKQPCEFFMPQGKQCSQCPFILFKLKLFFWIFSYFDVKQIVRISLSGFIMWLLKIDYSGLISFTVHSSQEIATFGHHIIQGCFEQLKTLSVIMINKHPHPYVVDDTL